jgi:hypothetical protein
MQTISLTRFILIKNYNQQLEPSWAFPTGTTVQLRMKIKGKNCQGIGGYGISALSSGIRIAIALQP